MLLAIDVICLNLKNLKLNPKVQIEFFQLLYKFLHKLFSNTKNVYKTTHKQPQSIFAPVCIAIY